MQVTEFGFSVMETGKFHCVSNELNTNLAHYVIFFPNFWSFMERLWNYEKPSKMAKNLEEMKKITVKFVFSLKPKDQI